MEEHRMMFFHFVTPLSVYDARTISKSVWRNGLQWSVNLIGGYRQDMTIIIIVDEVSAV